MVVFIMHVSGVMFDVLLQYLPPLPQQERPKSSLGETQIYIHVHVVYIHVHVGVVDSLR